MSLIALFSGAFKIISGIVSVAGAVVRCIDTFNRPLYSYPRYHQQVITYRMYPTYGYAYCV